MTLPAPKRLAKPLAAALFALLATAAAAVSPAASDPGNAGGNKPLTVMTRNVYLGGDIAIPLAAASLPDALQRGAYVWQTVRATDFTQRAEALADEIAAARPDLVGLQEVSLWRIDPVSDELDAAGQPVLDPLPFTPDAETVAYDFLGLLLDALEARGLPYGAVSQVENADLELPVPTSATALMDVRYTDRDVILARAGASGLHTANPQSGNFAAALTTTIAGAVPVTVLRGWASIDVRYRGETFRFFTAHPEAFAEPYRYAQLAELTARVQASPYPVVLVGDLNATPDERGYALLTSVLEDAWVALEAGAPGFTCCQLGTLTNPAPLLDERIDLVLIRGPIAPVAIGLVGEAPLAPPLALAAPLPAFGPFPALAAGTPMPWPSDHAGVVAELRLTGEQFLP